MKIVKKCSNFTCVLKDIYVKFWEFFKSRCHSNTKTAFSHDFSENAPNGPKLHRLGNDAAINTSKRIMGCLSAFHLCTNLSRALIGHVRVRVCWRGSIRKWQIFSVVYFQILAISSRFSNLPTLPLTFKNLLMCHTQLTGRNPANWRYEPFLSKQNTSLTRSV